MVRVHEEVARGLQINVYGAVFGQRIEHMVKKAHSGLDRRRAGAIEIK
jgi:hypothetical protein